MKLTESDITAIESSAKVLAPLYMPCDQVLALCRAWRMLDKIGQVASGVHELDGAMDDTDGMRWIVERVREHIA